MNAYIRLMHRLERQERRDRPRCGAKTRQGSSCLIKAEPGRLRCRLHGGLSTGPRTPEGRKRIAEASRARMLAHWAIWRQATPDG
jgi:hypothetical protein